MLNNYIFSIYIHCTVKNTKITITDSKGNAVYQTSSSASKIKDVRKNTPFILENISKKISDFFKLKKIKYVKVKIKGAGFGRYHILKNIFKTRKIKFISIEDITPQPFNGCRLKKQKRR